MQIFTCFLLHSLAHQTSLLTLSIATSLEKKLLCLKSYATCLAQHQNKTWMNGLTKSLKDFHVPCCLPPHKGGGHLNKSDCSGTHVKKNHSSSKLLRLVSPQIHCEMDSSVHIVSEWEGLQVFLSNQCTLSLYFPCAGSCNTIKQSVI